MIKYMVMGLMLSVQSMSVPVGMEKPEPEMIACSVQEKSVQGWAENDKYHPCVNVLDDTDILQIQGEPVGKVIVGTVQDDNITIVSR